jgi:hypothetical protein
MRWKALIKAPADQKEILFHPHLRNGQPGDKHSNRVVPNSLAGFEPRPKPITDEKGSILPPVRYGYRSFDRQWIIPDNRLINQPNPVLWEMRGERQVYLTALSRTSPSSGPAITLTGLIPDLDHYKGSFGGRVFPLWRDNKGTVPNLPPHLVGFLTGKYGTVVNAEDFMAYIAATMAHPAFVKHFEGDLSTPGLRVPITADGETFSHAAELGQTVIWLHTFGERMVDPKKGRPAQPPRLPATRMPRIPAAGEISQDPSAMPDTINYDAAKQRLLIGQGYVEHVTPAMWKYEVSGKQVLLQWFSYRKHNRERPIIGERRQPSPLGDIQPDYWLAEYTTELLNLLNVLGRLIDLETQQAQLLETICNGPTISAHDLSTAGALAVPPKLKNKTKMRGPDLFGDDD